MTRKTAYFEGWSWFKFNNSGLTLGTNLKLYTSVAKRLKLKAKKFWGLIPTFVEVTGEKLIGGTFSTSPIIPSWIGLRYFSKHKRKWFSLCLWINYHYEGKKMAALMWPKTVTGATQPVRLILLGIVKTLVWKFGDYLFTWSSML